MIKVLNNLAVLRKPAMALALLTLAACHNPITNPKPLLLDDEVDVGPPEYRQGYHDGCRSAMAAYGNSYMKTVYKISKTAQYADNRMYNQAWKDAWGFCYMSLFMIAQDSDSLL